MTHSAIDHAIEIANINPDRSPGRMWHAAGIDARCLSAADEKMKKKKDEQKHGSGREV